MEVPTDAELQEFLSFLTPELDQAQQELLSMFEFSDAADAQAQPAVVPVGSPKFAKTCKPRVKDGAKVVMHKVKQRHVSAQSIKFRSAEEEAHYRLHSVATKKTALIDKLVRACHTQFGDAWVTWKQVKAVATCVGYKPSSQLFKSVWVLTHCLYGAEDRNCTWVPALTFPYWDLDTTRYDDVVARQGLKSAVKDELYMLRLSHHFFTPQPVLSFAI